MLLKPCMVKEDNTTIIEIESYPSAHIPLHLLPKIPRHSALHNPFYDQNRVFIRSTRQPHIPRFQYLHLRQLFC